MKSVMRLSQSACGWRVVEEYGNRWHGEQKFWSLAKRVMVKCPWRIRNALVVFVQAYQGSSRGVARIFPGVRRLSPFRLPIRFHSLSENRLKNIAEILSAKQKSERSKRGVKTGKCAVFQLSLIYFFLCFVFLFFVCCFFFMYLRDFLSYALAHWSKSS